jgi:hypothetical protein
MDHLTYRGGYVFFSKKNILIHRAMLLKKYSDVKNGGGIKK